jgi:hypothetical protein
MGLEAFDVRVMEDLDRGLFGGSVHSLGVAIGPRMIWLGQLVFDAILIADAIEDVRPEIPSGWSVPVFGRSTKAMPLSVKTAWIA